MADTPGGGGGELPGPLAPGPLGAKLDTNTSRGGGHHRASLLPTQSSPHAYAGAGALQQGGFARPTRRRGPDPILHLHPRASSPPSPLHTYLKLISDLGPWGIRGVPGKTQSLSSPQPSLHQSCFPSPQPYTTHPCLDTPTCLSIVPEWAGGPQLDPWTVAP